MKGTVIASDLWRFAASVAEDPKVEEEARMMSQNLLDEITDLVIALKRTLTDMGSVWRSDLTKKLVDNGARESLRPHSAGSKRNSATSKETIEWS